MLWQKNTGTVKPIRYSVKSFKKMNFFHVCYSCSVIRITADNCALTVNNNSFYNHGIGMHNVDENFYLTVAIDFYKRPFLGQTVLCAIQPAN